MMASRMLAVLIFATILGGAVGFGASYLIFNSQIQTLQYDLRETGTDITNIDATLNKVEDNLADVNSTLHDLPTEWTLADLVALNDTVLGFNDDLASIIAYLDALNASMTTFGTTLSNVNATLSDELALLANQSQWIPQPSFDSGWIDITNNTGDYMTIVHDLNTTDGYVEISGKISSESGIHQHNLGGAYYSGWTQVHGTNEEESAWTVVQTSDGGYVTAGYIETSGGNRNFWLVKYSASGNIMWEQQFGGSSQDGCYSMAYTQDGGYALAGWSYIDATREFDGWLVKTDAEGTLEWDQTYGGDGFDAIRSIIQTSDGGYALAGYTNTDHDFWLVKTDASGQVDWTQTYGGANDEEVYILIQT